VLSADDKQSSCCLTSLLAERVAATPHAPAILAPGRLPLSYAGLHRQVQAVAQALAGLGLGKDDAVALVLPNGPELACALLGVAAVARAAPLNPGYRLHELDFYLRDLHARALIVPADDASDARTAAAAVKIPLIELAPRPQDPAGLFDLRAPALPAATACQSPDAEDVALLLHTSGTTARPKLVPLTHANLFASARNIGTVIGLSPDDRCLNVMPLFHIHGLVAGVLAPLASGGSVICAPGLDPARFFPWLTECAPTWMSAVPTVYQLILEWAEKDPASVVRGRLRLLRTGSAPLPPTVLANLEALFGVPVIETYGLTETATQLTSNRLPPGLRKPGSAGAPGGPELRIRGDDGSFLPPRAVGEVVVRGANIMRGYVGNDEANARAFADGWFRTGDLGYQDEDGYVFLTGRTKEMINRGGEKVSPREVEDVLLRHPAVAQAVVFALPHPLLGEVVGAAVVLRPGATVTNAALRAFAAEYLADFKVPSKFTVVNDLPKGATGKLQRIGLAKQLGLDRAFEGPDSTTQGDSPADATEAHLVQIWCHVLGLGHVSRDASFFSLGGDSLLATALLAHIEKAFGRRLQPETLYTAQTVAALAKVLASRPPSAADVTTFPGPAAGNPPSLILIPARDWPLCFRDLSRHLIPELTVYVLPTTDIAGRTATDASLAEVVRQYLTAVEKVQPRGPYYLAGYSFGGVLAFELARELMARGHAVNLIGLLDARRPAFHYPFSWKHLMRKAVRFFQGGIRSFRDLPEYVQIRATAWFGGLRRRFFPGAGPGTAWYYNPPPLAGKTVLYYVPSLDLAVAPRAYGWEYLAAHGVERVPVPGNHLSLLKEPNVHVLAEQLKAHVLGEQQPMSAHPPVNGGAAASDRPSERARARERHNVARPRHDVVHSA